MQRKDASGGERSADRIEEAVRGTVVWAWSTSSGRASFEPMPGSARRAIRVPIGWSLAPHPALGVVLQQTSWRTLAAEAAIRMAEKGTEGFRVIGGDEDNDRDDIG